MANRAVLAYLDADGAASELRWGQLPERIRAAVATEADWLRLLRSHGLATQSDWGALAGGDEAAYLEELLRVSREKGMLYPYHLAELLALHHPRSTPFDYYHELIIETMRAENSYDTIPNFTAADCVRLLGVGRNEFIHALNQCRSKGWLWKRRKALSEHTPPPPRRRGLGMPAPMLCAALVSRGTRSDSRCCQSQSSCPPGHQPHCRCCIGGR